jgi:hypothetical protein
MQFLSFQVLVKLSLVSSFGLEGLRSIVLSSSTPLPASVREKMLTFMCSDFQEVGSEKGTIKDLLTTDVFV